ncbi:TlpA disulfide reductase family protein [Candidatus Palauibacter sp.]|uniref:TlpA disulfide reductase family protein n=1 Tax=Candidatus Palauibacter sp. TaxID=3101350 RepID=UPI003C6EE5AB
MRRPAVAEERERRELGSRLEREAPDFAIQDQSGVEWRLGELAGKIVVLKFWATWCGPCLAEFPHFVDLLEKYAEDAEVVFLTVATAGSPRDEVAHMIEENGFAFPVLFDEQGLALDFEIRGYPTTRPGRAPRHGTHLPQAGRRRRMGSAGTSSASRAPRGCDTIAAGRRRHRDSPGSVSRRCGGARASPLSWEIVARTRGTAGGHRESYSLKRSE